VAVAPIISTVLSLKTGWSSTSASDDFAHGDGLTRYAARRHCVGAAYRTARLLVPGASTSRCLQRNRRDGGHLRLTSPFQQVTTYKTLCA
jgi:hypothetical protein